MFVQEGQSAFAGIVLAEFSAFAVQSAVDPFNAFAATCSLTLTPKLQP